MLTNTTLRIVLKRVLIDVAAALLWARESFTKASRASPVVCRVPRRARDALNKLASVGCRSFPPRVPTFFC
jgi:hypothetical protein